jgi:hypothetical protein
MRTIAAITCTLAAAFCSVAALAQTARPSDGQVQKLIEQTQKAEADFDRALDSKLKNAIVRGPSGEVMVSIFLQDFKTDIERMKERFAPKYAASAELVMIMRRAEGLDKFVDSQPASLKGRSEWDTFTASLNDLAAAYGTSFPMKPDSPPRRMNDLEIQQASDAAVTNGQALRKSLSSVYGKEDKESIKATEEHIDAMTKAAKGLKARVDDGKPASGEAAVFTEAANKVQTALGDRTLTGDAKTAADGLSASLSKVEQAFGMQKKDLAAQD